MKRQAGIFVAAMLIAVFGAHVGIAHASDPTTGDPVIAAVGDMACAPEDSHFNGGAGQAFNCGESVTSARMEQDHTIDMLIEKRNAADNGFNVWTINGAPFAMDTNKPVLDIERGKRYRLRLRNASDDLHPMHLHRHTFEITRFAGTPTAGVRKDVAMLGGYQSMEIDFVADQPGLSLLHCHQQIHMDYGLMLLLNSA